MDWFRWHGRKSGFVALLALFIQLGLSFGHVHRGHADHAAAALTAPAAPSSTGDQDDGDYCATCAVLALLAGAQPPNAPALAVPVAVAAVDIIVAPAAVPIWHSHAAFRPRAPPLS